MFLKLLLDVNNVISAAVPNDTQRAKITYMKCLPWIRTDTL